MSDKIIRKMHEVFGAGLELRERLDRSERPRFDTEHSRLLTLLLAGGELDYDRSYRGDLASGGRSRMTGGDSEQNKNLFLGVQYALACWLDEMFTVSAPLWWAEQWEGNTMEVRLMGEGSNERAWLFWEQAKKAEGPRGSPEAVEAYLWCVMLGFRGSPRPPMNPLDWVENARKRVLSVRGADFPTPPQKEPPTRVPALRGPERVRTMLRVAVIFGALAAFVLGFAVVTHLAK